MAAMNLNSALLDEHELHPAARRRTLHVDVAVFLRADHNQFIAATECGENLGGLRRLRQHLDAGNLG